MTIDQQTGLYGSYDFMYTPLWQKPQVFIPVFFVLLVCCIIVGYLCYRIIKKMVDYYTPHVTKAKKALQKLETIKNHDMVQVARSIQAILKEYSTKTYAIHIDHFTGQECSLLLQSKIQNQSEKQLIQNFFIIMESILFIKKNHHREKKELIAMAFSVIEILEKRNQETKK
jgi:hypothetical protein